ncbi:hypothetical protein DM01DRAFT_1332996 [Hesseltinella vesiculosa]|uniref:RPA-interacting protein C-terminal domain-containing protein n=1 Tax=Hesseltinella vesiculosa TaxID=101127 RepID=A0A1X2GQU9_9FUNG|nr:hypothetical protein DM01DRAFT_1332996 [Hesseltinella vesiculosa]
MIEEHITSTDDFSDILFEEYQQEQQQQLEESIAQYETLQALASKPLVICAKCHQSPYAPSPLHPGIYQCASCQHQIQSKTFDAVCYTLERHAADCPGSVGLGVDASDPSYLLGMCPTCDLWELFY